MDPQTALPQVLPLLLLLLSSPLGGRSLPLSSPDPDLERSAVQELLDSRPVTVAELREEQMSQKPLWQDRGSREAWEAKQKDSDAAREPRDKDFQALQGLETSMMMRNSSCFGRKMDRINRISGLGCNVLKRH